MHKAFTFDAHAIIRISTFLLLIHVRLSLHGACSINYRPLKVYNLCLQLSGTKRAYKNYFLLEH